MRKNYYSLLLEDNSKFYLELMHDVKSDMVAFRLYCAESCLLLNRSFIFDCEANLKDILSSIGIDTPIIQDVELHEEVFNFIIK